MKQIALILTLLLAAAGASAQEVFIGADFDTRFDNREHSDCNIDDSHTFFSMRLTPKAGVIWSEKNRLVVAVDLLQDFGDKEHKFLSKVDPQIYYQFNSKTAQAVAGIFPRSLLLARYDPFFLGSAYSFYNNRIQGLAAHYKSQTGSFIEFAIDWEGMRSYQTREKFRILSGGEYKGRHWYGGYVMTLLHYAKTDNTELDEGVVDHILLNPYVGYRYEGAYTFDARLGYLQSLQRDRRTEEGWKAPKGGRLALSVSRWGVCLLNELYVGENMLPFWDIYGTGLYASGPFYATPKKIYNQTAVTYNRRFFNNTVGVSAGFYFHYDGVGLGLQQILKVSVNLQKPFTVPKNRRKGGKSCNFVKIYLLWQSQPTTPIPRRKPRTFSKRSFRSLSPRATRAYRPVSRPNPTATCISATPRASASTSAWPRNTAASATCVSTTPTR